MAEKEVTVKSVIQSLRKYLYDNLDINQDLLNRCDGDLLEQGTVLKLRALLRNGDCPEAVTGLLRYMDSFYTMETLEKFVELLQELSQKYPAYGEIAEEFHRVMGRSHTPTHKKLRISPATTATSHYTGKKEEQVEDNVDSSVMSDEKKWGHKNGGCLVKKTEWDKLERAVVYIKSVGTGFIGTFEGCTYLFTCLHCFIENKKQEQKKAWLAKTKNLKTLRQRAIDKTYWFHYLDGSDKEERHGNEFIDEREEILPKVDLCKMTEISNNAKVRQQFNLKNLSCRQWYLPLRKEAKAEAFAYSVRQKTISDSDIIAIRLKSNPCEPVLMKTTPHKWENYYVTIYGHPGGEPLSRSIGRIEKQQNDFIWHDADTMDSSSGSPVVVSYGDNDLRVIAIHGQDDEKKRRNVASLLESFLELF